MPSSNNVVHLHHGEAQPDQLPAIAVVGFSLKFPQDATSPASFWKLLEEKRCVASDWPRDRISLDAFYHADNDRRDTKPVRGGHFLSEDLAVFDASFFAITATEAMAMDPQQRMLLETAYRALENAGIPMEQTFGSKTGVYAGSMTNDYQIISTKDEEDLPSYGAVGTSASMLANRLSWFFNFTGPSVSLDTACSSSLMALDLACQGLRTGESSMALVAGANIIIAPELVTSLNNLGFLSPDSRCYSFDDRANGYARGEGCGIVVLKRVADAIRDGDTIRAVIRSTGSNQNGHTPGITQPSRDAQISLIQETYQKAGLDFATTRFFEAHGTGTALGDPIELDAIGSVFRSHRCPEDPLLIGSVKSNIGHLEGGSGIAGLIKAILVLEKGVIPPNANFERINSRIDAQYLNIRIPTEMVPWPSSGLRRASVNSFGFGGSNSHAVLEDARNYTRLRGLPANHCTVTDPSGSYYAESSPKERMQCLEVERLEGLDCSSSVGPNGSQDTASYINGLTNGQDTAPYINGLTNGHHSPRDSPPPKQSSDGLSKLLVWSAADEGGLARLVAAYHTHFMKAPLHILEEPRYLEALSYTLALRRSCLPWRSYAVAESMSALRNLAPLASRPIRSTKKLGLAFIFSGQGAQYRGMGRELLSFPIFRSTLRSIDGIFRELGCKWSLIDMFLQAESSSGIDFPEYSQAMSTALQIALIELLRSFNIWPSAVVGHSSGEIAAAYAVGSLSLQSACKVSYFRGYLAGKLANASETPGAMISVNLSESEVIPYLEKELSKDHLKRITVACINSPKNVTISGDEAAIDSIQAVVERDKIFARKLKTGVAYHSPSMRKIAAEYASSIQGLEKGASVPQAVVMISSVTGEAGAMKEVLSSAEYWVQNMVEPVKFSDAITQLASKTNMSSTRKLGASTQGAIHHFIEIGPHSTLKRPTVETLATSAPKIEVTYSSALSKYGCSREATLKLAGYLFSLGYPIALDAVNQVKDRSSPRAFALVDLPEYPFNRSQKYWHESALSKNSRLRKHPRLELLGTRVADFNPLEGRWRKFFDVAESPWLEDHKIGGMTVYPAAGMVVMAIEGAKQTALTDRHIIGYRLRDVTFSHPIVIHTSGHKTQTQLYMRPIVNVHDKELNSSEFRICVFENAEWVETCRGKIQVQYETAPNEVEGRDEKEERSEHYKRRYDNAVRACGQSIKSELFYQSCEAIGLGYGKVFQGLTGLAWDGANTAIGTVKTGELASSRHSISVHSHVIHPAKLDIAAQLIWAPLTKGATAPIPTAVPTRIRDLWIAESGLGYSESNVLQVCARSSFRGLRGSECSMFALDAAGNLKISISSMETTELTSHDPLMRQSSSLRPLCFSMDWKPDPVFLSSQQILTICGANDIDSEEPRQFSQDLRLLIYSYFVMTLKELDRNPPEKVRPHIQKFVDWMKLHVTRELLNSEPNRLPLCNDSTFIDSLSNRLEKTNATGKLCVSVGRQLVSIIRGSTEPLQVSFSKNLAEDHSQFLCDTLFSCGNLYRYLDIIAHKNPAMQILEIGAGTGSMTSYVLSSMFPENEPPRFTRYDFTDIAESYLERAREKFSFARTYMNFKTLNIELDPVSQGFVAGCYDMVIACNVLHTTRDLGVTLRNTRKLLKPGGKLLLVEMTEPEEVWSHFAYGTLPGWWTSAEKYRKWSPCITEAQWNEQLSQNGFTGVETALRDYQSKSCHEMSLMISSAVINKKQSQPMIKRKVVLIVDPISSSQLNLAGQLQGRLQLLGHSDCTVLPIHEMPKNRIPTTSAFVFLPELEKPFLDGLDDVSFKWLQDLLSLAPYLLWVTSAERTSPLSPRLEMVTGLARVLRVERSNFSFINLALENTDKSLDSQLGTISKVLEATLSNDTDGLEPEYREKDGIIMINRVKGANDLNLRVHDKVAPQLRLEEISKAPPLLLSVATPGLIDSLQFTNDPKSSMELKPSEIEIEIKAVGVNFRDLLVVLGRHDDTSVGLECAGIVTRIGSDCTEFQIGDRVCAAILGCASTFARCDHQLAVKMPESLTYAEGAALPVTAISAYYALIELARLQKGDSILIHCGSGGTGQMAVQIAQQIGAEIYVTVGLKEKKQLMMDFYQIPENHIFYSRDTSFASGIMRMTNFRGVDVVLNSLSGEGLLASWECIAPLGRFIEMGKADIQANSKLPMAHFAKMVSFSALAMDYILANHPAIVRKLLLAVIDLVVRGRLKIAHPLHVYSISKVEEAFRFLQSGRSTGKIVLSIDGADIIPTFLQPRSSCELDPNATYLIAGGLGGLGRSAARWMASRGAKNLMLLSRSGPSSSAASDLLKELKGRGVNVATPKCDVSCSESLSTALKQNTLPPIKGCLQGTMVLRDALFEKMTFSEWQTTVRSKVQSSWNLHAQLPENMDFFIMLSSLAGIYGTFGLSNYAAGNTYQDALAQHRVQTGRKATALDLGWMSDVGIIAENKGLNRGSEAASEIASVSEIEFHALLEYFCDPVLNSSSPSKVQSMVGLLIPSHFRSRGMELPSWTQVPMFSRLAQIGLHQEASSSATSLDNDATTADLTDWAANFDRAPSQAEASEVVVAALVRKLAKALAMEHTEIDTTRPLHAYGVDSLLAVELRNWFAKLFCVDVTVFDIMGQGTSIDGIGALLASKSACQKGGTI